MKIIIKLLIALVLLTGCWQTTQANIIPLTPEIAQVHGPTIVETSPGNFLVAFYGGTKVTNPQGQGANDCSIWLTNFDQETNGWIPPKKVASSLEINETVAHCWDPVLCKVPYNDLYDVIHLFYKVGKDTESWTGYVKSSLNRGKTWTSPKCLAQFNVTGPHKCKPLILENGTLLFPATRASWNFRAACTEQSDVNLNNWQVSELLQTHAKNHSIQQPTIFQLIKPDFGHNFSMLFRSRNSEYLYQSFSTDSGTAWTHPVQNTDLKGSDSSLDAVTLVDGRIVLAYNNIIGNGRHRLVLAICNDGTGTSWQQAKIIAESQDTTEAFCYPAIIQSTDGMIQLVYVKNYREICYEVIHPDELS